MKEIEFGTEHDVLKNYPYFKELLKRLRSSSLDENLVYEAIYACVYLDAKMEDDPYSTINSSLLKVRNDIFDLIKDVDIRKMKKVNGQVSHKKLIELKNDNIDSEDSFYTEIDRKTGIDKLNYWKNKNLQYLKIKSIIVGVVCLVANCLLWAFLDKYGLWWVYESLAILTIGIPGIYVMNNFIFILNDSVKDDPEAKNLVSADLKKRYDEMVNCDHIDVVIKDYNRVKRNLQWLDKMQEYFTTAQGDLRLVNLSDLRAKVENLQKELDTVENKNSVAFYYAVAKIELLYNSFVKLVDQNFS